jgi:hypothetical protein
MSDNDMKMIQSADPWVLSASRQKSALATCSCLRKYGTAYSIYLQYSASDRTTGVVKKKAEVTYAHDVSVALFFLNALNWFLSSFLGRVFRPAEELKRRQAAMGMCDM